MKDYLDKVQQRGQTVNPLFNFLGVVVEKISPDCTVLRLPFQPGFIQGGGATAGGIMATLADEAMAHAALAGLEPGETTATIEMNIRYLKASISGDITATATLVKKGRRVITLQAEVKDESSTVLAQAGASFMILGKKS
jgi:uncharacterized protein (TIGR00369 family)